MTQPKAKTLVNFDTGTYPVDTSRGPVAWARLIAARGISTRLVYYCHNDITRGRRHETVHT